MERNGLIYAISKESAIKRAKIRLEKVAEDMERKFEHHMQQALSKFRATEKIEAIKKEIT